MALVLLIHEMKIKTSSLRSQTLNIICNDNY